MWTDVAEYQDKQKIEKYELGKIYKVKFYESTNAMTFKAQTYIYGTTAAITASANFVANSKKIMTAAKITEDEARAMTGKMLYAQYTDSTVAYNYPVCIERVNVTASGADIFIRYEPAATITANWTTAKSFKLVPYGGGASGATVFSTLVYGKDAFGVVELGGSGKNVEIIINPPGSAGAADPLRQRGSIAWKVKGFAAVILQDNNIVRIEGGATA